MLPKRGRWKFSYEREHILKVPGKITEKFYAITKNNIKQNNWN